MGLFLALPLLRCLLTLSTLTWPTWGQGRNCLLLRQTFADVHLARLLVLGLALLRDHLLATTASMATLAAQPRPPKPTATGRLLEDGTYEVVLADQFAIRRKPVAEFDRRLFVLFLRDIDLVDRPCKWPFLCQVWLAAWFGTLQELISRWEDYRAAGDWQRLMSRRDGPLLPLDQQHTLIQLWARQLWWTVEEVTDKARAQGLEVSPSRVCQIGQESGLLLARRVLRERFQLGSQLLRPKDEWLVQRLFALLDQLHTRLELGQRLAPPELLDLADVLALRDELGLGSGHKLEKALPWGYRLQQVLEWPLEALAEMVPRL